MSRSSNSVPVVSQSSQRQPVALSGESDRPYNTRGTRQAPLSVPTSPERSSQGSIASLTDQVRVNSDFPSDPPRDMIISSDEVELSTDRDQIVPLTDAQHLSVTFRPSDSAVPSVITFPNSSLTKPPKKKNLSTL